MYLFQNVKSNKEKGENFKDLGVETSSYIQNGFLIKSVIKRNGRRNQLETQYYSKY